MALFGGLENKIDSILVFSGKKIQSNFHFFGKYLQKRRENLP